MKTRFFNYSLEKIFLASSIMAFTACTTSGPPAPVTQKSGPVVVRKVDTHKAKNKNTKVDSDKNPIQKTRAGLPDAASSPLRDLNLRKPVPPDFLENLGYVYTVKGRMSCASIAAQIADIDVALNDLDTDIIVANEIAQKNDNASETTLDVIGSIASSIIPLRPVVRTVSGARKAKKHYEERFDNGRRRRAFLKGYGLAKRCKPPSAPLVTYAPFWKIKKPVDLNAPNKSWQDSIVPPQGK